MRNYSKIIGAMAAASALVAGNASAIDLEYNLHAGYTSEYVFRGINLGQDLIETGASVSTEVGGLALSGGLWYASFESGNVKRDELDLFAEASKDLGFAEVAVGYIWYHNFDDADDAQEVYIKAGRDFGFFDASIAYYWDVETDNDGYTELALSKGIELSSCLTLNLGATLGYLAEHGQLSHTGAKVSLDYAFTETATISPFVAATWSLNNNPRTTHGVGIGTQNELVGGAILSVSF